jgi:hypothetical protein
MEEHRSIEVLKETIAGA